MGYHPPEHHLRTATQDKVQPRRKLSKEVRRSQIIEATISTLGELGYSQTTLTDVAKRAGLSQALVNFHFQTKDKLFTETLLYISHEYRDNWIAMLDAAGSNPASRLNALLSADFNPDICTPQRLSAWCAFWGEAQSRPLYLQHCGSNDAMAKQRMEEICAALMSEGGYQHSAASTARVLRNVIEGVWVELMMSKGPYNLSDALGVVYSCASAFFPRHFHRGGLCAVKK